MRSHFWQGWRERLNRPHQEEPFMDLCYSSFCVLLAFFQNPPTASSWSRNIYLSMWESHCEPLNESMHKPLDLCTINRMNVSVFPSSIVVLCTYSVEKKEEELCSENEEQVQRTKYLKKHSQTCKLYRVNHSPITIIKDEWTEERDREKARQRESREKTLNNI